MFTRFSLFLEVLLTWLARTVYTNGSSHFVLSNGSVQLKISNGRIVSLVLVDVKSSNIIFFSPLTILF